MQKGSLILIDSNSVASQEPPLSKLNSPCVALVQSVVVVPELVVATSLYSYDFPGVSPSIL